MQKRTARRSAYADSRPEVVEGRTRARRPAPLAQPKPRELAAAKPEINRQERVIFTAYLVMFAVLVAFVALAGLMAWLGA
jgi:hypothetical protein